MNRRKKALPAFFLILLVALVIVFIRRTPAPRSGTNENDPVAAFRAGNNIVYSKHARCRMDCRMISEQEIREVLREGVINHNKSEPDRNNPRYALEDVTEDGQKVRLVIAIEKTQAVVVTCIDLEKEWPCNCR